MVLRLAEIDAAGQLAHDHDVEAVDELALERGGVGERGIADGGAEIGEQLEILAQAEQPGLGALVVRHAVPFRPADGAEHHGVGGERLFHGGVGDRLAVRVVGAAADEVGLGLDRGEALALIQATMRSTSAITSGPMPSPGRQQEIIGCHARGPFLCYMIQCAAMCGTKFGFA